MKRYPIWPVALLVLAGCRHAGTASAEKPAEPTPIPNMSGFALAQPVQSGNLAVVPVIYERKAIDKDDYATLAEALKHDWIEVIEMPNGEVNTLRVRNKGPKPILLLGGELLVGGKQDRVVAQDVVIQPGQTVEVEVDCVEHGRWTGMSNEFKGGATTVPMRVREEAQFGTQSGVWDRVGEFNEQAKAASGVTTIRGGLANETIQKRIGTDLGRLCSALREQRNVVGVIIAVDGKPRTLEVFGSPALFDASMEEILKGAIADVALDERQDASLPSQADSTCSEPTLPTCTASSSAGATTRPRPARRPRAWCTPRTATGPGATPGGRS
jgi:hypothetical protein